MEDEGEGVTLVERAASYALAFPNGSDAAIPRVTQEKARPILYATWVIGNDYRNQTRYYGAYPASYLARVMAMFPDMTGPEILHAFSGSLPPGDYARCDSHQPAEFRCSVYDLPATAGSRRFRLVLADPPYTASDAEKYGTPPVDRRRATAALAAVTSGGGYLAWLDTCWPMYSKRDWLTVGRIAVVRSTNHRIRMLTLFERTGK